ncbi:hypothetical protein KAR91_71440 [Candidatus Pacearchaeota archaeon]|nr:hypothetical protein [Candidatus Pacearchaeota archaeon]
MNKKSRFRIGITALGILLFAFAFCTNASSQTSSGERDQMRGEGRDGPPQEAIDACKSGNEGDSCSFETPRGSLSGRCISVKGGIVCAPKDAPQRSSGSGNERKGAPPQEAIDACSSKKENDSCQIETPRGTLSGSCRSIEDQLACAPKDARQSRRGKSSGSSSGRQRK